MAVALILLTSFATPMLAVQDASEATYYVQRSWSDTEGLPGQVWAVVQGLEGYLWLGTGTGLVRFDGIRFDDHVSADLPTIAVRVLCAARDGSLWIGFGGAGGISRLKDGTVTNYRVRDGIPTGLITSLAEDRDGTIWASSNSGVSQFRDRQWRSFDDQAGIPHGAVQVMYVDRLGSLWAATSQGIFRRAVGESVFGLVSSRSPVTSFSEDLSGMLFVNDRRAGFRRLDGEAGHEVVSTEEIQGSRLHHDGEGDLWVGTVGQGVFRITRRFGERVVAERFNVGNGLTSNIVRSVATDREGSLWVGTQNGLNQLSRSTVKTLPTAGDHTMNTLVRGVTATEDGSVWVGTADGLYRFAGKARTKFDQTDGLPSASILSMHVDNNGRLWVGAAGGISDLNGRRFSRWLPQGIALRRVTFMTSDSAGDLWLNDGDAGLFRFSSGKLMRVTTSALEGKTVSSMVSDRGGRIWIGFLEGGVLQFDKGTFRLYEPVHGMAGGTVNGLFDGSEGNLWISTNEGLSWFRDGRFHTVTTANGLPGNVVTAATEDDEARLWLGVKSGLVRIPKVELASVESDPAYQLRFTLFTQADGLRGYPIAQGSPDVARAVDGRVFFPTSAGVAIVDPRKAERTRIPPPVRIETINVDDRRIDGKGDDALPPLVSRLEIEYTALSFVAPSAVRFQYRLEGFDTGWVNADHQRRAVYTGLPPGRYRFQVVADNGGAVNTTGAEWTFSIVPTFYQTQMFKWILVVSLVVVAGAGWRLRARKLHADFLLIMDERARVAREIHDTLLQSMLGTALEIETVVAEVGRDHDPIKRRLVRLRDQIQNSIREMRHSIWDLRSPMLIEKGGLVDALKRACQRIVAGAAAARLEFSVTGTPRMSSAIDEQLLRLGQEAVRNAIRHADAKLVRVELRYEPDTVTLRVIDDGHGFDSHEVGSSQPAHWGLAMMEERAKKIGATFRVFTRPGAGTEIETIVSL